MRYSCHASLKRIRICFESLHFKRIFQNSRWMHKLFSFMRGALKKIRWVKRFRHHMKPLKKVFSCSVKILKLVLNLLNNVRNLGTQWFSMHKFRHYKQQWIWYDEILVIQHAQIQKVLKKVQFQSVRLLESVKSVCIISENEFDMIGSFYRQ